MSGEGSSPSGKQPRKLFVFSVALNGYAEQSLNLMLGLFLLDIAATFQVAVGTASQISIISSIAAICAGLVMGALSVRFSHKVLLMAGATIIIVGLLGCFFAPNFTFMQFFYPLDGIGSLMVVAMGAALFGRFLPLENRPKAMGWLASSATLAYVIGAPLSGFIAGAASWRYVLLWFFLPISIAGLILAYINIPPTPKEKQGVIGKGTYLSSFKQVLMNRSAAACLTSVMLYMVSHAWGLYAMTFYRTRFAVTLQGTSLILLFVTMTYTIGAVVGGRLVNRVGRQRLTILCATVASTLMVIFVFMPNLWIVLPLDILSTLFRGVGFTAAYNLGLEQVPQARGTYMSLSGMFFSLGSIIGTSIGSIVLNQFTVETVLNPAGFTVLVPILGIFGFTAVLVNYFFIKDPCKK